MSVVATSTEPLRKLRLMLAAEILLTIAVIAGGAVVRASGAGAGCGEHWPLCNGQAIPWNPRIETVIEFGHRLTSGLSLLLFVAIFFYSRRVLGRGHVARSWANLALVSFLGEAGIGAFLVLRRLVEFDTSALRAVVIALHLVNTYVLLAALLGMLWNVWRPRGIRLRQISPGLYAMLFAWGAVGATGAVVALGDTLFPARDLLHGWQQDFDPSAHLLIRLRLLHPLLAVAVSFATFLGTAFSPFAGGLSGSAVRGLILAQVICGFINWLLLAPLSMQIVHLVLADITWAALVTYCLVRTEENLSLRRSSAEHVVIEAIS